MGAVEHRAELQAPDRKQSLGADAALAALQNSLASYHQEKAAKSVTVTNSLIGTPKNRFEANRDQKYAHRRGLSGSQHASPTISASGTPRLGAAPTSVPSNDSALRLKAMRKPLIHLLAIEPLSQGEIIQKTRIPKADLEEILSKIGKQAEGKKMGLSDRAYKELDVYNFGYSTPEERQAAIENAVRAYDRQRIGKEEKIWQMLLPEDRRNKGEYLSKLHIGAPSHLTPNVGGSPLVHGDGDERAGNGSVAGTPRLGPGTPKVGSGKSDLMKKLAKNPKQRAIDDAKDKKRKEREAAKVESDKEGRPAKKQRTTATTAKSNSKIKSAELVQSSSEDEVGEMRSSQPKAPPGKREPLTNASAKVKPKALASASTSSSDGPDKRSQLKANSTPLAKSSKVGTPSARPASAVANVKTKPAPPGKNTPNGLHAPASQQRSQLSPNTSKAHHRPSAPSPLGAARPRVASDVSDRAAVGIQRARPGADTPKGLGISNANGIRRRHDTMTSTSSSNSDKIASNSQARSSAMTNGNGAARNVSSVSSGLKHKTENGVKRKAMDTPQHENGAHPAKHRKTESSSSHSQNSISAGSSNSDHDRPIFGTSPTGIRMTFGQGVSLARRFREEWYPAYMKLYDELEAIQRRGERMPPADKERLLQMHERLVQAKREIADASERERET